MQYQYSFFDFRRLYSRSFRLLHLMWTHWLQWSQKIAFCWLTILFYKLSKGSNPSIASAIYFQVGHPALDVTFSVCPSICRTPYLSNHTSSDHNFWYTYVNWWYLQVLLSFFRKFERAKNDPKWQKILSVLLHVSGTVHHIIVIFGTYV